MLKIVQIIFDTLFPPRPQEVLVRSVTRTTIDSLYTPSSHMGIVYLYSYQHALISALITENKFHQNEQAATLLADGVAKWLETSFSDGIIIPIPLSNKRKKARGYNQVEEVTKRLPLKWRAQVSTRFLKRNRHTSAQTTLNRTARLTNMVNAFSVTEQHHSPLPPILLIDDVTTTGATLLAAKAAIENAYPHAQITLLSLAH